MPAHTYEFNVAMSCGGCSGAVTRVLNKLEGVDNFDVSLEKQTVKVNTKEDSDLTYDKVLNVIGKTGKTIKEGAEYVGGEKVSKPVVLNAS